MTSSEDGDRSKAPLDLDVTADGEGLTAQMAPAPGSLKPYNPDEHKDRVREIIAKRLIWLLTGVVGIGALGLVGTMAAWLFGGLEANKIEKDLPTILLLLNALISPVIGLVGAVVGFYYGTAAANSPSKIEPPAGG